MAVNLDESDLLSLLRDCDSRTFEMIYERFSGRLYNYIYSRVSIKEVSEEIVQEIFISLWRKRETVNINTSLEAYLFGAAKFSILTYVRSEIVRKKYAAHFVSFSRREVDNSSEEMMNELDIQCIIDRSIAKLPERCRTVFHLSRIENEPISSIAERMNISRRTVENYLSQALKHLRTSLGQFFTVSVLWMISWDSELRLLQSLAMPDIFL
jgi:RNA polymerase sigma-70 factor (family 1)